MIMKSHAVRLFALVMLLALSPLGEAVAGLDVDFGASVRLGDDTDVFFAVSSRYFDRDRQVVESWGRRYQDPDDLAVALFLSKRSGRSPDFIFSLRRQGLGWWEIGVRVGVPVDAWFLPVTRDPGPPYGKAYGYWKKHRKNPKARIVLTDADVRNLVAVRMVHEYYGVPVEVAFERRASGGNVRVLLSAEYRHRHGKAGVPPGHAKKAAGKGHGKKKRK
jgi:hypothetical protein